MIVNKKVLQYRFFPNDGLIKKKKNQHTQKLNTISKTQNQNIHKKVQKLRIKKNFKKN